MANDITEIRRIDDCVQSTANTISNSILSVINKISGERTEITETIMSDDMIRRLSRLRIIYKNTLNTFIVNKIYLELIDNLLENNRIHDFLRPLVTCAVNNALYKCVGNIDGYDIYVNKTVSLVLSRITEPATKILAKAFIMRFLGVNDINDVFTADLCRLI